MFRHPLLTNLLLERICKNPVLTGLKPVLIGLRLGRTRSRFYPDEFPVLLGRTRDRTGTGPNRSRDLRRGPRPTGIRDSRPGARDSRPGARFSRDRRSRIPENEIFRKNVPFHVLGGFPVFSLFATFRAISRDFATFSATSRFTEILGVLAHLWAGLRSGPSGLD